MPSTMEHADQAVTPVSRRAATDLPPRARLMVGLVLLAGGALGSWILVQGQPLSLTAVATWTLVCLVGQFFSYESPDRRILVSLTTLFQLAMLFHVQAAELVAVIWLSRISVDFFVRKRPWIKVLFNTAQTSLSAVAAFEVFHALAGISHPRLTTGALPVLAPAFLVASVTYYVSNAVFVSGILAAVSGQPLAKVLRENLVARREVSSKGIMILLAPLAAFSFEVLGLWGLAMFLIPMILLRDLGKQHAALRDAQPDLARSERSGARGEMAVEVGYEINKYLTQVYGQLQLIMIRGDRSGPEEVRRRVALALTELANISSLSRGLMDFSRREKVLIPTRFNHLVKSTVSSLSLQNRLDGVTTVLDLDPRVDEVTVDPLQIQQCLRNLLINSADAVQDSPSGVREIVVRTACVDHRGEPCIEVTVSDSGAGLPDVPPARLFEPGFTTRSSQRGMGLCTAAEIARSHQGTLQAECPENGQGAVFRLSLPLQSAA